MKKIGIWIFSILILLVVFVDYRQHVELVKLKEEVSLLQNIQFDLSNRNSETIKFIGSVSNDSFDYLAIGNSITIHSICDYWFGEWGMAASSEEKDYYHLIIEGLEEKSIRPVNSITFSYCIWETQGYDRSETWPLLDAYLVSGIDLITVQLSENSNDISTLESDLKSLILHIKEKCGQDVIIIIIDDFWNDRKSEIKRTVVEELNDPNVLFVDLSDIRGESEYACGLNTVLYGTDGSSHINEHEGVAIHPGDEGMKVIASRVLDCIEKLIA